MGARPSAPEAAEAVASKVFADGLAAGLIVLFFLGAAFGAAGLLEETAGALVSRLETSGSVAGAALVVWVQADGAVIKVNARALDKNIIFIAWEVEI